MTGDGDGGRNRIHKQKQGVACKLDVVELQSRSQGERKQYEHPMTLQQIWHHHEQTRIGIPCNDVSSHVLANPPSASTSPNYEVHSRYS
jgi:hypothetical protein